MADRVLAIKKDLAALADGLGKHGGAVKFISDTFGQLHHKAVACMETIES